MDREELIRFLVDRIKAELDEAASINAGQSVQVSGRHSYGHRASAYCDVLERYDSEAAMHWKIRTVEVLQGD